MPPGAKGRESGFRIWRICKADHAAFTGEGARLYGGRWNHPRTPVVCASSSLALASLEFLVHAERDLLPDSLVSVSVLVPPTVAVEEVSEAELPAGWRTYPAPQSLKDLGSAWAQRGESCLLSVPSAVIPAERNFLINPLHPEFPRLQIGASSAFEFDPRLWE